MKTKSLITLTSIVTLALGFTASIGLNASALTRPPIPQFPVDPNAPGSGSTGSLYWSFDFTLDSGTEAKGVFQTENKFTPTALKPGQGYLITNLTGSLGTETMTLLPVRGDGVQNVNDNSLYPYNPPTYTNLNLLGFSFAAGNLSYNIYSDDGMNYYEQNSTSGDNVFQLQSWTPVQAVVPEPSTILGLIPALGLTYILKRQVRKKKVD